MLVTFKSLLPFALLGTAGVVGFVAHGGQATTTPTPTTSTTTAVSVDGPVRIEAAFEHAVLPAGTEGETFLRVALTGLEAPQKQQRLAVGLTLVIDRSGSMGSEQKMETANDAACRAVRALQPGDRFAVLSFDDGAELLARDDVSPATVDGACRAIHNLTARGATDMIAGLMEGGRAALEMTGPDRVSRLLLLSDGRPNGEGGLREHAALLARQGVVTTTVGLGTNYNEDLMASIADAGVGNSWFVESRPGHAGGTSLAQIFGAELSSMTTVVAKNATLDLHSHPLFKITEVIGFPSEELPSKHPVRSVAIGDLYVGHTTELLLRVKHRAFDPATSSKVSFTLRGTTASSGATFLTSLGASVDFSADAAAVERSRVATVTEKVEEYRTTQALLAANEAWNRGDQAGGDAILNDQKAKVQAQASTLGSARLQSLFSDVDSYQQQNTAVGTAGRASMNKVAKEKARDYVRSAKKR